MMFYKTFIVIITFTILLFSLEPNNTLGTIENTNASSNAAVSTSKSNNLAIKIGEGNSTVSFTQYFPSYAEINVGDSITWYNGLSVPNPHTVTFAPDLDHLEKIGVPFYVSNYTEFVPVIDNLGKPIMEESDNGRNMLMVLNANALFPTIINNNDEILNLKKDAVVNFEGDEKFVNSGPILSLEKKENLDYFFSNSFTLTFNKAGLYEYSCLFHPWMVGKILVR